MSYRHASGFCDKAEHKDRRPEVTFDSGFRTFWHEVLVTGHAKDPGHVAVYALRIAPENALLNPTPSQAPASTLTHLQRLEAESIHIMREVVAETEKPVML